MKLQYTPQSVVWDLGVAHGEVRERAIYTERFPKGKCGRRTRYSGMKGVGMETQRLTADAVPTPRTKLFRSNAHLHRPLIV